MQGNNGGTSRNPGNKLSVCAMDPVITSDEGHNNVLHKWVCITPLPPDKCIQGRVAR